MRMPSTMPDPRLIERLVHQLRWGDPEQAFVRGGEALAVAILATRGTSSALPSWVSSLADVMLGRLLWVSETSQEDLDPGHRVRKATAAVVLSVIRPHAAVAVDAAVSRWMRGLGTPRISTDVEVLAHWALLALLTGERELATEAVHTALETQDHPLAWLLYDWLVAINQHHGTLRLSQCYSNTLTSLLAASGEAQCPSLLVLAAVVFNERSVMRRREVLTWLDQQVRRPRETAAPRGWDAQGSSG